MILVDSGVWIDFLVDRDTPQTAALKAMLKAEQQVGIGDIVMTEVLQGTRDERSFAQTLSILGTFDFVTIVDDHVAIEAARHYRHLRERGITVRKTIDTLIATRCILDRIPLLYGDRDFDPFVEHLGLRPALLRH